MHQFQEEKKKKRKEKGNKEDDGRHAIGLYWTKAKFEGSQTRDYFLCLIFKKNTNYIYKFTYIPFFFFARAQSKK